MKYSLHIATVLSYKFPKETQKKTHLFKSQTFLLNQIDMLILILGVTFTTIYYLEKKS